MKKTFFYQSFSISYSDTGSGMPVLLLHGFGEDSRIFQKQVENLAATCRVIVPDLPASGESKATGNDINKQILNGLPASIDDMAAAMSALIAFLGIEKYVLLGHSMGGYIALAIAANDSTRLAGLGLIHSTAFADSEEKKATRRKGIEFIERNGGYAFLQTSTPGLFSDSFKASNAAEVAALIEQFNLGNTGDTTLDATLTAYYTAMINRPDRTVILRQAQYPVLFIIGTEDKAVPMHDILQQTHLTAISFVHILENIAHMSMKEKPDILNAHLWEFIQYTTDL